MRTLNAFCLSACLLLAPFSGCAAPRPAPAVPSPSVALSAAPELPQISSPSAAPELPENSPLPSSPAGSILPESLPSPAPSAAPPVTADPSALAPSTRMTYEELVGDNGDYDPPADPPPAGTYSIEIDLTNRVLSVLDAGGAPVRQMLCTTGRWDTPTPKGEFTMGKQRERFGYFEKFECYAQYWSQIDGDIFIHSVLYREKDADTLIRSSYRNLGRSSSHGCVRLTVPDARWIYENVAPGSSVRIVKKERDKALVQALSLPKAPS